MRSWISTWPVPDNFSAADALPEMLFLRTAPGSARNVMSLPLNCTASSMVPWSLTNGRAVASAIATCGHGMACEHDVLFAPAGSTYATLPSSPHEPSGRHAFDVQST